MKLQAMICGVLLAGLMLAPTPSRAGIDVFVDLSPPAPRHERARHRTGYVWVNGHYQWRRNRYVWQPGHYEVARRGAIYVQPRWVQEGNRWGYQRGTWRDRDGDGRNDRRRDRRDDRRDRRRD